MHYGLIRQVGITTIFQRPLTVPLHNPNSRQMPAVRSVQGDWERIYTFPQPNPKFVYLALQTGSSGVRLFVFSLENKGPKMFQYKQYRLFQSQLLLLTLCIQNLYEEMILHVIPWMFNYKVIAVWIQVERRQEICLSYRVCIISENGLFIWGTRASADMTVPGLSEHILFPTQRKVNLPDLKKRARGTNYL